MFYLKKIIENDIHYFKKYLDLLNQKDLDVVFITLPNYLAQLLLNRL